MDEYETSILDNMKVYCPKYIIQKYKHKHAKDEKWTRFYYYKNKKRVEVPTENIDYDYEVSSTLAYNQNVFYKMTTMSNSDTFFDFYFKLKPSLPDIVIKNSNKSNSHKKSYNYNLQKIEREYTEDGKMLVKFP